MKDYLLFKLRQVKNAILPNAYLDTVREFMKRREAFYRQYIRSGDLCFDVGANRGDVVEPLLNIGAKIIAIEPQISCYNQLKWKFGNKIELIKKGLGEKEDVKEMYISDADSISSFSEEWIAKMKEERFKDQNWNNTEKVEMTTLDKLIEKYGVPRFIKIDVEGYELEVLKGLSQKVFLISFEYTAPEQLHNTIACIQRLEQINSGSVFNYATGSSMELVLKEWLPATAMLEYIKSEEFATSSMGDIYVKS